ncbi:hypothetical protein F01_450072 [Burkholderia cenocepacia]|nr:hypothetical protein F01_450072 [Burkholderia cenocepacia]
MRGRSGRQVPRGEARRGSVGSVGSDARGIAARHQPDHRAARGRHRRRARRRVAERRRRSVVHGRDPVRAVAGRDAAGKDSPQPQTARKGDGRNAAHAEPAAGRARRSAVVIRARLGAPCFCPDSRRLVYSILHDERFTLRYAVPIVPTACLRAHRPDRRCRHGRALPAGPSLIRSCPRSTFIPVDGGSHAAKQDRKPPDHPEFAPGRRPDAGQLPRRNE